MRMEKTQINKIRKEKRETITNTKKILGIIRAYIENLYLNKLENLEEMDKFLDTYENSKLNQEDINYLHKSVTPNEIEAAIKILLKKKSRSWWILC
jgi:hypothetical protein